MSEQRPHVERLLDLALYVPVGVLVALRDDLPKHVRQGRQAVENRVQLARFIGELAVQQGRKELGRRIDASRQAAADAAAATAGEPAVDADEGASDDAADAATTAIDPIIAADDAADVAAATTPSPDDLPIAEYESLAAIHVVERLSSLHPDELEDVRRFEAAHRARRTVLAKIAQLQGDG